MYPATTVTVTPSLTLLVPLFPLQNGGPVSWFISHLFIGERGSIVLAVFMTPNILSSSAYRDGFLCNSLPELGVPSITGTLHQRLSSNLSNFTSQSCEEVVTQCFKMLTMSK